jgi:hypothetical protein
MKKRPHKGRIRLKSTAISPFDPNLLRPGYRKKVFRPGRSHNDPLAEIPKITEEPRKEDA